MERYKNGEETREQILNVCRDLFYRKGYDETTYSDICNAAHINRGLIHYHFKSKTTVRDIIFNEESEKMAAQIKIIWPFLSQYEQDVMLEYLYWYKFFKDPCYRRFFASIFSNLTASELYGAQTSYLVESPNSLPPEASLNIAFLSGLQATLSMYVPLHLDKFSYKDVARFEATSIMTRNPKSLKYIDSVVNRIQKYVDKADMTIFDTSFGKDLFVKEYNVQDSIEDENDAYINTHEIIFDFEGIDTHEKPVFNTHEIRSQAILDFCKTPRSRNEIMDHIGLKNREYFRKNILTPLIKENKLKMTEPENPKSKRQKYISETDTFLRRKSQR